MVHGGSSQQVCVFSLVLQFLCFLHTQQEKDLLSLFLYYESLRQSRRTAFPRKEHCKEYFCEIRAGGVRGRV